MKTLILTLLFVLVVVPVLAQTGAQGAPATDELKALMQKTMDAWATMDPANAAPFYDTESKHPFFDLAPLQYLGWKAYAEGSQKILATVKSVKFTPATDIQTHRRGNIAWGTGTWPIEMIPKEGKALKATARYTVIWEKRGEKWLIVHDHFSIPAEPPTAPKP